MQKNGKDIELETMKILTTLEPRKELTLRLRFGIGVSAKFTHEEIGEQLGIPPEDVARLEEEALRDLRHPSRSKFLDLEASIQAVPKPPEPSIEIIEEIEKVKNISPELIKHLKEKTDDLEKLNETVVEQLVAEILRQQGFKDVQLVGRNPNTSADILATQTIMPSGIAVRLFVEVKRWKDKVGIEVINNVYGAMMLEKETFGCNAAMIVSMGGFKDMKKINNEDLLLRSIYLRDKEDLIKWLYDYKPNENGLWLPPWANN
jgi:restriction endonuclease Mrr